MKIVEFEALINNLGKTYETLVVEGVASDQPLTELYKGRDRLGLKPEPGINLSFWRETKRFESLFVTLKKTTPSTVEYKGEFPSPYASKMTQSDVHSIFGEAMEVKRPVKMPEPMGQTGGWESYRLNSEVYPGKKVVFQYTAEMEVDTLVFTLIDKGHD